MTGCAGCAGCASGLANIVAGGGVKGVAGGVDAGPGTGSLLKILPPGSGGGGIDGFAIAPEGGAKADTNGEGEAGVAKGDGLGIGAAGLLPNRPPLTPPIVDSNGGVFGRISLLGVAVSSTDGFNGSVPKGALGEAGRGFGTMAIGISFFPSSSCSSSSPTTALASGELRTGRVFGLLKPNDAAGVGGGAVEGCFSGESGGVVLSSLIGGRIGSADSDATGGGAPDSGWGVLD